MKAWRLEKLGGALTFEDLPLPKVRPHSVLIRMEAVPLLSYLKDYAGGKLPTYSAPAHKFTPGTNGVGVIEAVGGEVWQLKVGQRVVFSPYLVAAENVDEAEQILIGLTSMGPGSAPLQADWPDGTLAQFALAPVSTVTPVKGLERMSAAQLAVLNRAIVPFGGLVRRWSLQARPAPTVQRLCSLALPWAQRASSRRGAMRRCWRRWLRRQALESRRCSLPAK